MVVMAIILAMVKEAEAETDTVAAASDPLAMAGESPAGAA
jgi:hypothetical protein